MPLLCYLAPRSGCGMGWRGGARSLWEGPESWGDGLKKGSRANRATAICPEERTFLDQVSQAGRGYILTCPVIHPGKESAEGGVGGGGGHRIGVEGGKWNGPSCHKLYDLGPVVISTSLSFLICQVGLI